MRQHGKLANWNDEKGFGFIMPSSGGSKVFVHISAFPPGGRRPEANDPVIYSVTRDRRKRPRAEKARFQNGAKRKAARARGVVPALGLFVVLFAALSGSVLAGFAPLAAVGFYALMSAVSFIMYVLDKAAAQRGSRRTPEATLHLAELAGGWPGALVAQRVFRHKTNKQRFQFVFWCAAIANCAALVWLLGSDGAAGLRTSLGIG